PNERRTRPIRRNGARRARRTARARAASRGRPRAVASVAVTGVTPAGPAWMTWISKESRACLPDAGGEEWPIEGAPQWRSAARGMGRISSRSAGQGGREAVPGRRRPGRRGDERRGLRGLVRVARQVDPLVVGLRRLRDLCEQVAQVATLRVFETGQA